MSLHKELVTVQFTYRLAYHNDKCRKYILSQLLKDGGYGLGGYGADGGYSYAKTDRRGKLCQPETGQPDLLVALKESLKLQARYAELLNKYDEGRRIVFNSPEAWIARLRETGALAGKGRKEKRK